MSFTVQRIVNRHDRKARRGTPSLPAGANLHVITIPGGGWFTWAYTSRDYAEHIAAKLTRDPTFKPDFNRVRDPQHAVHTFRETE